VGDDAHRLDGRRLSRLSPGKAGPRNARRLRERSGWSQPQTPTSRASIKLTFKGELTEDSARQAVLGKSFRPIESYARYAAGEDQRPARGPPVWRTVQWPNLTIVAQRPSRSSWISAATRDIVEWALQRIHFHLMTSHRGMQLRGCAIAAPYRLRFRSI